MLQSVDRISAADELVAALRLEVDELSERSERLRARVSAAEREAVLLSEHLTTKSVLAGELRADAVAMRGELDVLHRERSSLDGERASLVEQLAAANTQLSGRQVELDGAREQNASLELQLDRISSEITRVQQRTAALDADLAATQVERDDALARFETAQTSASDLAAELAASVAAATFVSQDLDAALARLETTRGERDAALAGLDQAQTSAATLTAELAASVAAASTMSDDLESVRGEASRLRGELAAAPTAEDVLASREAEARIRELEAQITAAHAQVRSAIDDATQLTSRLDVAEAERDQTTGALASTRELLADTEHTRDQYAHHLKATAPTTLGRLAYRWRMYGEQHARRARLIKAPFEAIWRVVTLRWPSWLRQHPLFDKAYYEQAYGDVAAGRLRPWWHYVRHGIPEGRQPNRYFDRSWYLNAYPDVAVAGFDPLDHYFRRGCWEGRDPGPRFSSDWYLAQHPDVAASGACPLLHFITEGAAAGYASEPHPSSSTRATTLGAARAVRPSLPVHERAPVVDPRAVLPASAAATPVPMAASSPVGANVKAIRKLVATRLPADAHLGVVSDGSDALLDLPGMAVTPVPRGPDGARAADVPRNQISAVAHIESLRAAHIDYLLAPQPSLWLTAVPGLIEYLDGRYERIEAANVDAFLWDLRAPLAVSATPGDGGIQDVLGGLRDRIGSEPSILDWEAPIPVARMVPTATVFNPQDQGDVLRYADDSIDAVVFDGRSERASEARRVSSVVTIALTATDAKPEVEWHGSESGDTPTVSIVIPSYEDATMAAGCLRTLEETVPQRIEAEFIVVDDGSSPEIVRSLEEAIRSHPRARLVRNEENGGYIAAATTGAAAAQNDMLVFLNNDTVLLPGWLEPLLKTFVEHPSCGVVGGMLLYPDGRLQEAGCAIFRDGSATKIGYGDTDPSLSYYAHPRPVDYVSGALLATPKALFDELGGLDAAYGFGYYEDGDYCFKVRRAGREVLYQPASRVVHVEGGTAGRDLTQGPKAFQARNQALFIERWQDELDMLPVRPEPLDLHASRDLVIRGSADHAHS